MDELGYIYDVRTDNDSMQFLPFHDGLYTGTEIKEFFPDALSCRVYENRNMGYVGKLVALYIY
jgi:hypothetical protein